MEGLKSDEESFVSMITVSLVKDFKVTLSEPHLSLHCLGL